MEGRRGVLRPGGHADVSGRRAPTGRFWAAGTTVLGLVLAGVVVAAPPASAETLAEVAAGRGFHVGTAAGQYGIASSQWRAVVESQFTSLTMGNEGKWDTTEPVQGQYDWGPADAIAEYARVTGKRLRGHTLVWHQQLPGWVSDPRTATEQRQILIDHVTAEAGHFAGQVAQWDVVNEPLNEDGTLRSSVWYDRLGESYIADALRAARAADPQAKLFINDYNVEGVNAKSTGLYNLVSRLKAADVPIDGVGLQAHLVLGQVPGDMRQNIERFTALGLTVEITELDVRIPVPADDTELAQQAADYRSVVSACASVSGCGGVTTWGASDNGSWIPSTFPGYGSALMFDEQWRAKPAYSAVVEALGGTPQIPVPPAAPPLVTVLSVDFEGGTQGWHARGGEVVSRTQTLAHGGTASLLTSGRTATWQGPAVSVLDVLTPGKLYTFSAWVRLSTGSGHAKLSMERDQPGGTRYEGVSAVTAASAGEWTHLTGEYLPANGLGGLSLYVETTDSLADLLVDDVTIATEAPPSSPPTTTSPSTATVSPTTAVRSCDAVYRIVSQWRGGFQGEVTITAATASISGWSITWDYADGQAVRRAWNATVTQKGATVTAKNARWNGTLAPLATTSFGFVGSRSTTISAPTVTCTAR